jgi:catechol-2,3-dioxygenase
MKKKLLIFASIAGAFVFGYYANRLLRKQCDMKVEQVIQRAIKPKPTTMKLGAFSVSLNVKDLKVSKTFYETLGFTQLGGGMDKNYLIMKNENAIIGLFQGMFQGNILTFNPGWDENAQNIDNFEDVRQIQKHLKSNNIPLSAEADETTSGPASIMLTDPDGNVVLVDQHR